MDESKRDPLLPNGKGPAQFARFGVFELRLDTGELHKAGVGVRLQRRSFCVLQALLQRHGEVVTREELCARLWSQGTFVDFESGLNTAVNRLRSALGDSAETPVYVETMARLGYRFIAPVIFTAKTQEDGREKTVRAALPFDPAETGVEPISGRRWWMAAVLATTAAALISWLAGTAFSGNRSFFYKPLTFSSGFVQNARFLPDGKHVVYSSVSHGNSHQAFITATDSKDDRDPQALNLAPDTGELAGVAPNGEIAWLVPNEGTTGTRVQLVQQDGRTSDELGGKALSVDWAMDRRLGRIFVDNGWFTLEYPVGRQLYRTRARLETARVSPQGDRVAFIEHPIAGDDAGRVMVVGPAEAAHSLSAGWESVKGLAWHPSGGEVWFTAATSGIDRKLWAVNVHAEIRQVAAMPGGMILLDINRAGEVLIVRPTSRVNMLSGNLRNRVTRDISLLDCSKAVSIAADGKSVLFDESGEGGGRNHSVYIDDMDKNKAERIGDGRAVDLSTDGQWALTQKADDATALSLVSARDHSAIAVQTNGAAYNWARFIGGRDRQEIVAGVTYPGSGERLIEQELPKGSPVTVLNDSYLSDAIVDEAGRMVAGTGLNSELVLVDLANRTTRQVGTANKARPVTFGKDGRVITSRCSGHSIILESVDLKSGAVEPYGEVQSNETADMSELIGLRLARDGQTFVYSQLESLSTLYIVSGWI